MAWYNASWLYRKKLTVTGAKVAGTGAISDAILHFDPSADADIAVDARVDGFDILFTESDGTTKVPHELLADRQFVEFDAIWSWFSRPRSVYHNGTNERLFIGIQPRGIPQEIVQYDYGTDTLTTTAVGTTSFTDDHIHPAILVRSSDSKLVVAYPKGHTTDGIGIRISTNAEDATAWGSETEIDPDGSANYAYCQLWELSGEGKIYLIYRVATGQVWKFVTSSDGGATWSASTQLTDTSTGWDANPYIITFSNGSRIDFLCSSGSPNVNNARKIYHFYYDGTWRNSAGTDIGSPGFTGSEVTTVYDGTGASDKAWISDIKYDSSGRPHILFYVYPSGTVTDQDLYEAEFDGSSWTTRKVCDEGTGIEKVTSPIYPGVAVLDPNDDSIAWVAKEESSVYEIQKWKKTSGTWAKLDDVTSGSYKHHFRPDVPFGIPAGKRGGVLFCSVRDYTSFTNYFSGVTAFPAFGSHFRHAYFKGDIHGTNDTDFYVYYGNSTATNQQDRANVWTNYSFVWHTQQPYGASPGYYVAAAGSHVIDWYKVTGLAEEVSGGDVGVSLALSSTEQLALGSPSFATQTAWTAECWAKAAHSATPNDENNLFSHVLAGTAAEIGMRIEGPTGNLEIFATVSENTIRSGSLALGSTTNIWQYWMGGWSSSGGNLVGRKNKTQATAAAAGSAMDSTASGALTFGGTGGDRLRGNLAELRLVIGALLSQELTDTQYDNWNQENAFYTIGSEETDTGEVAAPMLALLGVGA